MQAVEQLSSKHTLIYESGNHPKFQIDLAKPNQSKSHQGYLTACQQGSAIFKSNIFWIQKKVSGVSHYFKRKATGPEILTWLCITNSTGLEKVILFFPKTRYSPVSHFTLTFDDLIFLISFLTCAKSGGGDKEKMTTFLCLTYQRSRRVYTKMFKVFPSSRWD